MIKKIKEKKIKLMFYVSNVLMFSGVAVEPSTHDPLAGENRW